MPIDGGHGEDAGAHFSGHAKTGKISGPEGIFCKPFAGDADGAGILIGCDDTQPGKKGGWESCKEIEPVFDGVPDKIKEEPRI